MSGFRPSRYVNGVVVSPRIAYVLERAANLTRLRVERRGDDPEFDETLQALRWLAMGYADRGHATPSASPGGRTEVWFTPAEAAARLAITEDAVRLAIRRGRLHAEKFSGRWRITAADLEAHQTGR